MVNIVNSTESRIMFLPPCPQWLGGICSLNSKLKLIHALTQCFCRVLDTVIRTRYGAIITINQILFLCLPLYFSPHAF